MSKHLVLSSLLILYCASSASQALDYDYTAYTQCKTLPEAPLYDGGVLADEQSSRLNNRLIAKGVSAPAYVLNNLSKDTKYIFSCWVKARGVDSTLVRARLNSDGSTLRCLGTVVAQSGCWSFLKGGFVLDQDSETSILYLQNVNENTTRLSVASASLQPFSDEEWSMHQEDSIAIKRRRTVTIHVTDKQGNQITNASISVQQTSKDFPFGSAIANTILQSNQYQEWFVERFNTAVFENELKWYANEPQPGQLNYAVADKLLQFVMANQIVARGHNIFWEDPKFTPMWVRNLTGDDLQSAVMSRIQSLMTRYKGQFIHWDVSNEMLHFNFYEKEIGSNASLEMFHFAQQLDPLATLFMNEFNVIETCEDPLSTVDTYVSKLRELQRGGATLEGIGLEAHFGKPNIPLMRAILDKLATLNLPIWLTEIDISRRFPPNQQAMYLEEVLREGFSHPSVNGIMLWSALHSYGCYQMCLTDSNFTNLPTGDVVDKLLNEWQTNGQGITDEHGEYSFSGFLGEYKLLVNVGNKSLETSIFLSRGYETKHLHVQL